MSCPSSLRTAERRRQALKEAKRSSTWIVSAPSSRRRRRPSGQAVMEWRWSSITSGWWRGCRDGEGWLREGKRSAWTRTRERNPQPVRA